MKINKIYPAYFLFPAIFFYFILFVVPSTVGQYFAFTDWNAFTDEIHFIGLQNFKDLFSDASSAYYGSIKNTLSFTIVTVIAKNVLGLLIALALNKGIRGTNILRSIYFFPVALAPLAIGLLFNAMLNFDTGIVNILLNKIGLGIFAREWLVDLRYVMGSIAVVDIWRSTGFCMVIYLAGLQGIPKDLYESCMMDGAGPIRTFRNITLPLIVPSINVNIFFSIVGGLKVFDIIIALTKGGPGTSSQVLNTMVYRELGAGRYGMGTALGLVLFVIISIVSVLALAFGKSKEVEL